MANLLNVYDYFVVSLILGISILIGLYYAIEARYGSVFSKTCCQKVKPAGSSDEQLNNYLMAGKQMTAIP